MMVLYIENLNKFYLLYLIRKEMINQDCQKSNPKLMILKKKKKLSLSHFLKEKESQT